MIFLQDIESEYYYVAKLKLLSPWELAFIYELKINAFIDNFGTKLS